MRTPFALTLKGPVVIGVTFVLAVVTAAPFKVSLVVTFPIVETAAVVATVIVGSFTASIILLTNNVAVAVSQFVVFTASHI